MTSIVRPRLSQSDPSKACRILESVKAAITDQDSLTFLNSSSTTTSIQLPRTMTTLVQSLLIDQEALDYLTSARLLNWCRSAQAMFPLQNVSVTEATQVGDSLLRAVSISMWGVDDLNTTVLLRRLVHVALSNPVTAAKAQLTFRWKSSIDVARAELGTTLTSVFRPQHHVEWLMVSSVFADQAPHHTASLGNDGGATCPSLHPIHVFALSNILQRPIVILPGGNFQLNTAACAVELTGIYLPIIHDPAACCHSPIVLIVSPRDPGILLPLVFRSGHSLSVGGSGGVEPEKVVPLVGCSLVPLFVQCLLSDVGEQPQQLMQQYLRVTELPFTSSSGVSMVPVAKIDVTVPAFDMLAAFVAAHASSSARELAQLPRSSSPSVAGLHTGICDMTLNTASVDAQTRCTTLGCEFFGRIETGWKCSECYRKGWQQATVGVPLEVRHLPAEQLVEGLTSWSSMPSVPGTAAVYLCATPNCNRPIATGSESHCPEHSPRNSLYGTAASGIALTTEYLSPPRFVAATATPVLSTAEALRCQFPSCEMFGLSERGGYCSQHHMTMLQVKQTKQAHPKCASIGCNNHGQQVYGGVCGRCHFSDNTGVYNTVSASNRGIPSSAVNQQLQPQPAANIAPPVSLPLSTSECIMDFCRNRGLADYKGLCHECFTAIRLQRLGCENSDGALGAMTATTAPSSHTLNAGTVQLARCVMEGCREAAICNDVLCPKCFTKQAQALAELNALRQ